MLIDENSARHFILHYQMLLESVADLSGLNRKKQYANKHMLLLAHARAAALKQPELQEQAVARLQQQGHAWPQDMADALATLREEPWIYLRDTGQYAVFLEVHQEAAYAVRCLTSRLRDILGGSGAFIRCGLLVFQGQVISDGLVSLEAWLGANYKRSFNATVAQLRANGQFYRDRLLSAPDMAE